MSCLYARVSVKRAIRCSVVSRYHEIPHRAHRVHRTHRDAIRRARRVTGRFAPSSVLPLYLFNVSCLFSCLFSSNPCTIVWMFWLYFSAVRAVYRLQKFSLLVSFPARSWQRIRFYWTMLVISMKLFLYRPMADRKHSATVLLFHILCTVRTSQSDEMPTCN